jgi:UDP-N-acetyl-2-amino-2-deoxyglucuronate dehydrogenase
MTGVAGYIAPRHLKAIKETGNNLIAAVDPHDSVGILDQYFPECAFFTEIERFDRHLEKLKRKNGLIDYMTICSPNHLHDAHIRLALRLGANVICEKPLVLNPWNLDAIEKLEEEFGKKVYTILQLRVHPSLTALKEKITTSLQRLANSGKYKVELNYVTSRGPWYKYSWKGDTHKSGGVATNIGVHFFDLLIWLFGKVQNYEIDFSREDKMKGTLELENADVNWFLSIDRNDLPKEAIEKKKSTYRSIKIDNKEIEFTEGFTDLHAEVYRATLNGNGFTINDARQSIELVHKIRNAINF